jgi:hypothetical protein
MAYVRHSTMNPTGFRPWNFALSSSGMSFYQRAAFPLPTPSGLGDYQPDPTALAMQAAAAPPPPDYTTPFLVLGGVAAAAWWWLKKKGHSTRDIFSLGKV